MQHIFRHFIGKFRKKNTLIGLDSDGEAIHALELAKDKLGKLYIQTYNTEKLVGGINDGSSNALQKISDSLKKKNKHIAVALPSSFAIVKTISLKTTLDEGEIENFLALNSEKYFGNPIEMINIDHKTEGGHIKVLAAHKEQINEYLAKFRQANLFPKVIDIDLYALERSSSWLFAGEAKPYTVINIDINRLLICSFQSKKMLYSRSEYFNWQELADIRALTNVIMHHLELSVSACGQPSEHLYICGSQAIKSELVTALQKAANLKIETADPIQKLCAANGIDCAMLKTYSAGLMVCLGLALRKYE